MIKIKQVVCTKYTSLITVYIDFDYNQNVGIMIHFRMFDYIYDMQCIELVVLIGWINCYELQTAFNLV